MSKIVISAMYHFVTLENFEEIREQLKSFMKSRKIKGTLLLAREGLNGTVAGSKEDVKALLEKIKSDERFAKLSHKESYSDVNPFQRTKVKLKKEIVTMGVDGIDPKHIVGTYVKPKDWNALISDPEVVLIDTRNDYEYQIGTFKHAKNPVTDTFKEFPDYVKNNLDPEKNKKVAMFCTGGIRCEKSTAYLKEQGFENVYHLEGGILKYLEEVPEENTMWQGECFVFDDRVAVNHKLEKGIYSQCHGCGLPITEEDKQSEKYVKGVSCIHCHDNITDKQRHRFSEREKQIQLAKLRGEEHMGENAQEFMKNRKAIKQEKREADKLT